MSLHEFFGEEKELEWFYSGNEKNFGGQTVGYRRVSGKVGLTSQESGVRGAWVEKRVALFKNLLDFGYHISVFTELTDPTKNDGLESTLDYAPVDTLILEFGGTNIQFYKKQWDKTVELVKAHKGKIIFINDDPDLPFLWSMLPEEDWSRWTIAVNAVNTQEAGIILKAPEGCRVVDLPMSTGMPFAEFHAGNQQKVVYIGRPNGRTKYFKKFLSSEELVICGKSAEWESFPEVEVIPNPEQKHRRKFYQQYAGCLAVYDDKHMKSGWRTGRAYHALYAGIPVCAPAGNAGLSWCYPINEAQDISKFANKSIEQRKEIWLAQKSVVEKQLKLDLIKL